MSHVTGISKLKPSPEYHEVPQHEGRALSVYTYGWPAAFQEGLPVEHFTLSNGFLENAWSLASLASRMTRRAYEDHGKQLRVVTYDLPDARSQAAHNQAFMAVVADTWERNGFQAVSVGGHSRGGRTAIEGSLRLGRLGMIKDVWGITPAGFSLAWPPKHPLQLAASGVAACRELVGDANLILRRPKTLLELGNIAMHAAGHLIGDIPGSIREAHEVSTGIIAAEATELCAKNLVRRVGLIIGRDDGICPPGQIGKILEMYQFGGTVMEVPTTHLGPLLDPQIANVLTDALLSPDDLPEAPKAA
jgi:pimeloyl-ACP methyl ester carboxylesterase